MTDRAKKVSELTALSSLAANDVFLVVDVSANTTKKVTFSTIRTGAIRGPFANDSAANTGGVAVGELYYTVAGDAKVRLT